MKTLQMLCDSYYTLSRERLVGAAHGRNWSREIARRELLTSDAAGAGELPGLEALLAEDRPPLCRLERHRRFLAACGARRHGFHTLTGDRADGAACPLRFAGLAPLRFVL